MRWDRPEVFQLGDDNITTVVDPRGRMTKPCPIDEFEDVVWPA
jgi:hypothetical protein